uniref:hypothetical protein n=1 Tax=Aerosakkonema funiforme TaxID=1246630 RepID=UPI003898DDB6
MSIQYCDRQCYTKMKRLLSQTMQLTEQQYYSPEEYLALEEVADYKSEYIDGQIFPMTATQPTDRSHG